MNDYLVLGLSSVIAAIVVYVGVHWKCGNGVLTRLFRVVIATIAIIGNIGFVLGRQGLNGVTLTLSLGAAIVLVIIMVIVIQQTIINRVQREVDLVFGVVGKLSANSTESATSAEEQAAAVAQMSSAVSEIQKMSKSTADTSQGVVQSSELAMEEGQRGLALVRDLVRIMEQVADATDFVDEVNDLAEQSNLLALNAGIEAAKAHQFGRGFAVVAQEVRKLSEQSQVAANKIGKNIRYTESGQQAARSTDSVISSLGAVLRDSSEKARMISSAAMQQSASIQQIAEAMGGLVQTGEHARDNSKRIKQAADDLRQVSHRLLEVIYGRNRSRIVHT